MLSTILCAFACIFLGQFALAFEEVPVVESHVPAAGETGVPLNQFIEVTFNVSMKSAEFTIDPVFVGQTQVWRTDKILHVSAAEPLHQQTLYTFHLSNATSTADHYLAVPVMFSFTTLVVLPTVSVMPANGTTNVAKRIGAVHALFDQVVKDVSIVVVDASNVPVTGTLISSGMNYVFQFSAGTVLKASEKYIVTINANSNTSSPIAMPESKSSFTTEEADPSVEYIVPMDQSTDQDRRPTIVVRFSLPMNATSVSEALTYAPGFAAPPTWNLNNTVLTGTSNVLKPSTQYTVVIHTSARTETGVFLPEPDSSTFTTGEGATLVSSAPAFDATRVPTDLRFINATYDESMDAISFDVTLYPTLLPGENVAGQALLTHNDDNVLWEITAGPLRPLTNYTMQLYAETADKLPAVERAGTFRTAGTVPTVAMIIPTPLETISPYHSNITLKFNEMMDTNSVQQAITTNPVLPSPEYHWDAPLTTLTIVSAILEGGRIYELNVSTGAQNADGTPLAGVYITHFSTLSIPTVTESQPADQENNVNLNITEVFVVFSDVMNPVNTTIELVRVYDSMPVPGRLSWGSDGKVLIFFVDAPLNQTRQYRIIANGVSAAGIPMTAPFVATFRAAGGLNPPAIHQTSPKNNTHNVFPDSTNVTITFDSDMNPETVMTALSVFPTTAYTAVWSKGNSVLSLVSTHWADTTQYTVQIDTRATDVYGVHLPSLYKFYFTTSTVPVVLSADPNGNDIPLNQNNVTVLFSMPMFSSSIEFHVRDYASNIEVGDDGEYISGTNKSISHIASGNLKELTIYQIYVIGRSDSGYPGTPVEGPPMRTPFVAYFRTQAVGLPVVVSRVPEKNSGVPLNTAVSITFNQAMDASASASTIGLFHSNGDAVEGTGLWLAGDKTWWFNATNDLAGYTNYSIKGSVKNAEGTPLAHEINEWFRTIGVVSVESVAPANNTKTDALDGPVVVTFSHPVNVLSFASRFSLFHLGHTGHPVLEPKLVAGNWTITDDTVFSFKPDEAFTMDQDYLVVISSGVTDADGSALENDYESWFSTAPAPAPVVTPAPSGLSGGAIAGIIIAVVAGIAIIGGAVWYFKIRKPRAKDYDSLP